MYNQAPSQTQPLVIALGLLPHFKWSKSNRNSWSIFFFSE